MLIYRLVKKGKLKREAEEAQRTAAEERERKAAADRERRAPISRPHLSPPPVTAKSERPAYLRRASLDRRIYRVVGVTFDNDDGPARNRQEILREILLQEYTIFMIQSRGHNTGRAIF